jgi:Acetyltransferase (GNAT) domain
MKVERYDRSQKELWDEFVKASKNGTFLFVRDYMDYHENRYLDHSLLVWDKKGRLIALLPANRVGDTLISHEGLTYGGFITNETMKTPRMLEVFEATLSHLRQNSFRIFRYKAIPHIYHRYPAEEDKYALFLCNAKLIRAGVLTVVRNHSRLSFQERRSRAIKKGRLNGLTTRLSDDFDCYWEILTAHLLRTYDTKPVHSLDEIRLLQSRFPNNIKLFACFRQAYMLGGVVVYESERVAHVQYVSAIEEARNLGAIDLIFDYLLTDYYREKRYFDFGTADEHNGRTLNKGLIDQKEGFGARAVISQHYQIQLSKWTPGDLLATLR